MAKQKKKVVFILGAGFSAPALELPQSKILERLNKDSKYESILSRLEKIWKTQTKVPLEDVYTLLDRAVERKESVAKYSIEELNKLRDDLTDAISEIHSKPIKNHSIKYIKDFANALCELRWETRDLDGEKKKYYPDYNDDRVSIISTNWDVLLEEALGKIMQNPKYRLPKSIRGTKRGMFMDFCMFEFQLKDNKPFTPNYIPTSLRIKPYGFANLKILKLHGGINWFQCPRCDGVIVNLIEKGSYTRNYKKRGCPVCRDKFNDYSTNKSKLKRYFISPTFLKDFNATHFRSIWWNAGYEIAEASHLVFIGYSLPLSDFDFRHLISRNIDPKAKVTAILYSKGIKDSDYERARKNFRDFFGDRVLIKSCGVKKFIQSGDMQEILKSVE